MRRLENIISCGLFIILLATYWFTVAPTVSYWDCPEYVTAAALMEVGHPPGNPVWMLMARIFTLLAPGPRSVALAVNLSSGLFTAGAGFFLARIIFRISVWIFSRRRVIPRVPVGWQASTAAIIGTLAFGWCDSVWYSAVEAEVYALSIFFMSLTLWLMVKWGFTPPGPPASRLLILTSYLFGLTIGVHQLNLLAIPALAAIWGVKHRIRRPRAILLLLLLSMCAVGAVLAGMMPASIDLAARFELFAVNFLGLPALTGVAVYILTLGASLLVALAATARARSRIFLFFAILPAIFMSGLFSLGGNFFLGAILSVIAAAGMVTPRHYILRRLHIAFWMLAMTLTGYASYAIIPIRGGIPSPANAAFPSNPFSFAAYQAREQYGSSPLLYGPGPYSRPLFEERFRDGRPDYTRYALRKGKAVTVPFEAGATLCDHLGMLTPADSALFRRAGSTEHDTYIVSGYRYRTVPTPELNSFLPRITGRDPGDLAAYASWIGMVPATMDSVEVSETIDSLGHPQGRLNAEGERVKAHALRPTPLQQAQWFASYQAGYMYFRYLLWNFAGRQNDLPSQGEVQHGNFISGLPPIDKAMLGPYEMMPEETGTGNPGHNRYFLLPLALGILGFFRLLCAGRAGKQVNAAIFLLFLMTGLAIVIYLNQGPGEPRERDYTFLGSYMAFSIWIGFGALALLRLIGRRRAILIPTAIILWMGIENFDDHDRSHRYAASELAANILRTLEPQAILFVDGDNYTFPLWYAQEVEECRRDVTVINLSYLSLPEYSAARMVPWRDAPAVGSFLSRGDIIWGAPRHLRIAPGASDTLPADSLLRFIAARPGCDLPASHALLSLPDGSDRPFPLRNLSPSGTSRSVDFSRLMMFNFIAASTVGDSQRPVYWLHNVRDRGHIRLDEFAGQWLFGSRYGKAAADADSLLYRQALTLRHPNRGYSRVYLDRTPARQIAAQRFALIGAARRLLDAGMLPEAISIALRADILMGTHPLSYGYFRSGDSLHNSRRDLGLLMLELGDSARIHPGILPGNARKHLPVELGIRGRHLLSADSIHSASWNAYRRALPPRLRTKMAPVD